MRSYILILGFLSACSDSGSGTIDPVNSGGSGESGAGAGEDDSGGSGETGGTGDDTGTGQVDDDLDGYASEASGGDDCDDTDNSINPGATEVWYDGVDQDCSGGSDYDADGDGVDSDEHGGTDCDDTDAELQADCPDPETILDHYSLSGVEGTVEEIAQNLSGITWNPVTETLVGVLDSNKTLYEFDTEMAVLREIELTSVDHSDTEDIVYVGQASEGVHTYAIVTEDNVAYLGDLPHDGSTELDLSTWQILTYDDEPESRNSGGEGIAYEADTDTLWPCKEKDPMVVQSFARPSSDAGDLSHADGGLSVSEPFDAETVFDGVITDISACIHDPRSGRMLVLSQEARTLVDVGQDGTVYGSMDIDPKNDLGKAEGIALLTDGTVILVGEPNNWTRLDYSGD